MPVKITDPSKLLPSAKGSSSIIKTSKVTIKPSINKIISSNKGLLSKDQKSRKEDIAEIHNKLIKIEKFLKSDFLISQNKGEKKRREKEKQNFEEAEKKLETPESKQLKLPGIASPSLGFFDRIKRFLFFTALGWLVPKIIEFLPKLEGFAKIIGGVYKFAEGLFGKLFDGFMSLVKFGGDLKDKTLGFIATAKAGVGGDYQKEFDKLEKQFNTFVNASIIAGLVSVDIGLAAIDEYNKQRGKPGKTKPGESRKPGAAPGVKAGAKITQGRGGEPKLGKKAIVTGSEKVPSWWNKILKGPFAKLKGPLKRFAGSFVPGLGAAVGAADAAARFKAGDKIGGTLASVSAALDAATVASALTGIGLPVAGILGTISMSIDVVLLIRDILSLLPFIPKNLLGFSRGGRIVRKYQGGGTTSGRPIGGARRTLTPTRKKPIKIKPPKTKPGKDVGGEKKIRQFYSKESGGRPAGGWLSMFNAYTGKVEDTSKEAPYRALTKTAEIFKNLPFGLGHLMGGAIDTALGEKMDVRKSVSQLSLGIGYLVDSIANQRANASITSLMRDMRGFAEGGNVPESRQLRSTYSSLSSSELIAKVLEPTIDQRVNEAIESIQKELRKKKESAPGQPSAGDDAGGGGLDGGDFSGNTKAMKAFNFFKSQGYTDYQAAAIVGNLLQENSTMDPTRINSIGMRGIAQWDANRWSNLENFAASKNLDPNSFETQLQFIQKELKTGEGGLSQSTLKGTKTLEDATIIFRKQYERPGEAEAMDSNRIRYARGVLSSSKTPSSTGSASALAEAAKSLRGMSTVAGPEGGNKACVWAVNQVFKKAGIPTPWGNSNYVPDAESAMIRSGYTRIKPGEQRPGDLYIVYGQEHIGIVLPNGNVISNSSTGAKFSWEASTSSYESYYGGPGKFYRMPAPPSKRNPADTANRPSTRLSLEQARDLQSRASNLKPGDSPVVIPGIGSIQMGTDFFGNPKKKYFNREGKEIKQQEFNDLMQKYKLPTGPSIAEKAQGGGLIGDSKINRPIPNSFAPYETYGSGMMIAIQPVIIEKKVPVSGRENMISFPVPVSVNSNMGNLSLSRG